MSDLIDRQALIDAMAELQGRASTKAELKGISKIWKRIKQLPSAQPTLYGYNIEHLAYIAMVMKKEGVTAEYAVQTFDDMGRAIKMIMNEAREKMIMNEAREIAERKIFDGYDKQTGGD